jgi:hypothetical protein
MGAAQVLDTLPLPDDLGLDGAAPLRAAIHEAEALLSVVDPGKQRFLVIITDGAPNCAPEDMPPASFDELDAQVQDVVYIGALGGIRTALIAFDPSEGLPPEGVGEPLVDTSAALDAIAFVGGISPAALVADDVASLQARLSEVREQMPSDRLRIPDPSFFDYQLEVGGTPYGPLLECDRGDGFVLLDSAGAYDTMQLCGQAALDLQRWGSATIVPFCGIAE